MDEPSESLLVAKVAKAENSHNPTPTTPLANGDHEPIAAEISKTPKQDAAELPTTKDSAEIPVQQTSEAEVPPADATPNPKSPSTSSLSSLSSSSPEPGEHLLIPLNGTARELSSDGDSEAETDRLSASDLREELERTRRKSPLQRIDEDSPRAFSEDNLQVKRVSTLRKRRHSQGSENTKRIKVDISQDIKPELQVDSVSDASSGKEDGGEEEARATEEAMQAQRKEAISCLTEIEVEFAKLRDRIHADKMARFIAEIEMCAEGTHPELESVYEQIQTLHDAKIRRAEQRRKYQRICIDNQTRASRDQLHQQFLKDQADTRAKLLLNTTEEWYRVNRERRVMDALVPEYGYRPSESRSVQARQRTALNYEIASLESLSRYVGFPAAPEMQPGTEDEIEEDLKKLSEARLQSQHIHQKYAAPFY